MADEKEFVLTRQNQRGSQKYCQNSDTDCSEGKHSE